MRLLALLALVAGCTSLAPEYRQPEVDLPGEYPSSLSDSSSAIPLDWWKLYNDPALDELVASRGLADVVVGGAGYVAVGAVGDEPDNYEAAINYLYGNTQRADQKPAEDMYDRLTELVTELEQHKERLQRLIRMVTD